MSDARTPVEYSLNIKTAGKPAIRTQRSGLRSAIALLALAATGTVFASAQVNVTTYHNDIGRTGQNLNETTLNTSNVNPTQFGKLFSQPVDGQIYAQPLYLSGIVVNGVTHNVVFVATENDSVYAFDADTNSGVNGSPLWQASMLSAAHGAAAGATTIPSSMVSGDISPKVGITGTPVIDPATGTLYVVSAALEGGTAIQRLHALDVTTGLEKFGGPVVITASVPGTGNGSVNGTLTFDKLWENQRPGLLLLNGIVWIGFASHGDNGPWHGWILGYNASTLAQTGAYCATPNGTGAGFWMSGEGLAADVVDPINKPYGRIFVPTGNGDYTATPPYTNNMDYGDSHLALDLSNGVPTVSDEFTTNAQASLNAEDGDVASGGLMVIPDQTTGPYPHLAVQEGKGGTMYLLNRDNMGGYNTTKDQAVQEQAYVVGSVGVWSTPAYWNGNVYYWGRFDTLKSFTLANGLLSTSYKQSTEKYGYPGSTPSISANGSSQGIVWSIDSEAYTNSGPAVLQAHDASNVATTLYSSATNAARDSAGGAVKFTVPTVVNGKVYVPAAAELDIYGLLNGVTQTFAPSITPGTESYAGTLTVTITDGTPNATIYYTTNGTPATTSSTVYTGPITVSSTVTINAIAGAPSFLLSAQATATYTNVSQASAVSFSLPTGTYGSAQTLTLTDSVAGSTIYYTTDGSTPTTASTVYTGPISIGSTQTVTAIAAAPGLSSSIPIAQTYTIIPGQTGISFSTGFAASATLVNLNGSAQLNDSRLQLTSGLTGQAGSAWYYQPVSVQAFTTDFTFQLSNPSADGITFAIQNSPKTIFALGGNGGQLAYQGITNSVAIKFDLYNSAGEGADSTGLYTNGAAPTVPAIDLTNSGINLHSDDAMAVHLTYDGTTLSMTITDMVTAAVWSTSWAINIPATIGSNTAYVGFTGGTGGLTASQKILTWSYFTVAGTAAATPTFTPAAGSYSTAQTVAIASLTAAANIYYTTDGSTPTTSSTPYTGPVTVSTSQTLKAIATASGYNASPVATAVYTISGTTATPVFTPAGGTYTSAQTVSITDATASSTIYYTTDGSTPTTSSTVYTGPITVSASKTLKAIASATGYTTSAVSSAVYTISSGTTATPTFSPAGGTYTTAQSVTIADATPGATIYYTIGSTMPTTASTVYTGPITVSTSQTINALAAASGYTNSSIAAAAYSITPVVATPALSLAAGTYTGTQTLTITDATAGATIYYTTNGTIPTTSSTVYSGPISISTTQTITAIAAATGYVTSPTTSAVYTISTASGTISFPSGFASAGAQLNLNGYAAISGSNLQLTSAGIGQASSAWYSTPVNIQAFTNDFTFQLTNATANGFTFAIQNGTQGFWSLGGNGSGLGYQFIANSVAIKFDLYNSAGEGTNSTGLYLNGAVPTTPFVDLTPSGVNLHSGDTMAVHMSYDGTTLTMTVTDKVTAAVFTNSWTVNIPTAVGSNTAFVGFTGSTGGATAIQNIQTWSYGPVTTPTTATPTFTPAAGTYTGTQSVTLADATAGAAIYYTTNGTTPTTASTLYSGAIAVSTTQTINAIAVASGLANSAVGTAAYTINTPVAATPTFSLAAGTYTGTQSVTLADTTAGAAIYYTTNGTTPTTASTLYSGAISVSATQTIKAIAVATGYTNSAVASAAYTIKTPVAATPTLTPAAGTYTTIQSVTLADTTAGAAIYYTTNGTTPTTASTLYSAPISVSATQTVKAIAVASGYTNSAVASAAYTINLPAAATPTFTPAAGTYATTQSVTIADTTTGAAIYYTTDGTTPTTASALYAGAISVSSTLTIKAIAVATGYTNSAVASAAYTIGAATAAPAFSLAAGSYNNAQSVSLTDATPGATIYYTLNGTTPTTASTVYSGAVSVKATQTIQAIAIATGFTQSPVSSATYTLVAATPVISPAGGSFTAPVTVTITSASTAATIYYTTNGNLPTTSSTRYTGAITVSATQTIKALAAATGYTTSAVASNIYTISATSTATPTFSPAAGSYTTAQSVTLSDTTPGAVIYYTTDGSAPSTSSAVYSAAIPVSTTQTINAIAVAGGVLSSTATANYTISAATPTVNYPTSFTSAGLNLNGATITGGALQLTDGGSAEGRTAWTSKAVNIQKFTTDFNFQQTAASADGFTFAIQNGSNGFWSVGSNGGGLGYAGIGSSVAIKFDLYSNAGEGADSTGFYTNGATPTTPAVDMTSSGINLHSGDIMHAHITYDGTTLTLTITDTVTNASFTTSTAINIPTTVGANTAFVGFTGGTGGLSATQQILNWTYAVN